MTTIERKPVDRWVGVGAAARKIGCSRQRLTKLLDGGKDQAIQTRLEAAGIRIKR